MKIILHVYDKYDEANYHYHSFKEQNGDSWYIYTEHRREAYDEILDIKHCFVGVPTLEEAYWLAGVVVHCLFYHGSQKDIMQYLRAKVRAPRDN